MLQPHMNIEGNLTANHIIREAAERSMSIALAHQPNNRVKTPFGSGQVSIQEVQPGLRCELHSLNCHSDLEFECTADPQINCSITLEGDLDGVEIDGVGVVENYPNQATMIGFGERTSWIRRIHANQYFKTFCLTLEPLFLERFANNFNDQQLSVLDVFRSGFHAEVLPQSQRLITLGNQAFDHSYNGGLAMLYLESNTLQFVLEMIRLLKEEHRLSEKIGRNHYHRLMHAKSILDNSLLMPPKTLDLAREVGTNVTTLQAHFKLVLGVTIFGYVKSRRLEMAKVLIKEHRLAIAEAAFRVGFSSPSAFTASYRKHFGHAPSFDVSS